MIQDHIHDVIKVHDDRRAKSINGACAPPIPGVCQNNFSTVKRLLSRYLLFSKDCEMGVRSSFGNA